MQTYLPTDLHHTAETSSQAKSGAAVAWHLDWMLTEMPARAKFLLLIDSCSRKVLAAVGPCTDKSDHMIAGELDRVAASEGYPWEIQMDAGFEAAAGEILAWCSQNSVYWTISNRPRSIERAIRELALRGPNLNHHRGSGRLVPVRRKPSKARKLGK
jgi:hypothetical protein